KSGHARARQTDCPKTSTRPRLLGRCLLVGQGSSVIQRRVNNVQARNQALHLVQSGQRLFAPLLEKVALCGLEGSFQAFLALVQSKGMAKASLDIGQFSVSLRKPVTSVGNRPLDEIDYLLQALRLQLGAQAAAVKGNVSAFQ